MTSMPYILTTPQFKRLVVLRLLTENCLLFLLQYTGLMFCVLSPEPLPFNFATGTAIGFIFMRGYTILPGIWLGTLVAYYFSTWSFGISFEMATLYALYSVLFFWISLRYISPSLVFYRLNALLKFLLMSGLLTLLLSTNVSEWLRNTNGILTMGLAMTTWDLYFPDIQILRNINKSTLVMFCTLISTLSLALPYAITPLHQSIITSLLLASITYISFRFGWCGAVAALFISTLILNFQTYLATTVRLDTSHYLYFSLVILSGLVIGTYKNKSSLKYT